MQDFHSRSESAEAMLHQLKNPFDPRFVKCRVGARTKDKTAGIPLFYIDSREVMKRLDEVCGIDGWKKTETPIAFGNGGIICELSLRMPNGEWLTKSGVGECSKVAPLKGASSDSMKRAAVNFGIGRYLYYIPNFWCPLDGTGNNFAETPQLPEWALPTSGLEDWETVAIKEYNPDRDIDIEENPNIIIDEASAQDIKDAQEERKRELIEYLKHREES